MVEQVMELSAEVEHSGGGPSIHSTCVQDDRPLAPTPIHVAVPVDEAEEGEEESDEDYVADSGDSDLSDSGDENECVLETPVSTAARHILPPPLAILALSAVPSDYYSLDLDTMHERTLLLAAIEKNGEGIPKMRVTHCDRRASVFVVEELEPFEGWGAVPSVFGYRRAREAVFKVYEMGFSPIPDESMWAEWHGMRLCPNPVMRRKATRRPVSTRFWNHMDETE
ncbi:hypothetical protein Ahy_A06g027096 [Arachis hypogaea]|uniref:Uncharacterized protein n=1 Tax=Arachis hypogaea TaxID=3818 RepID=A0A445CMN1_ARAHY|nr:hypothetical protein Ahy_A06g027096 [Arachis hypogaea]